MFGRFPLGIRAQHLALGGLMLIAAIAQPASALAHFEGDRWSWSNGHHLLWINYDNNCSPFTGVVDAAISGWNATPTPTWFNKMNSGCNPMDNPVDVYTGYNSNPDTLAWTQNYERDCFITCWWDADWDDTVEHSIIRINTNVMWVVDGNGGNFCYVPFIGYVRCRLAGFGALSFANQQNAVTHELGHTLGLAHAGFYAGEFNGNYSVMDYCCPGYSTPRQHDINDMNALYPGW
jgi:hypothetical protein